MAMRVGAVPIADKRTSSPTGQAAPRPKSPPKAGSGSRRSAAKASAKAATSTLGEGGGAGCDDGLDFGRGAGAGAGGGFGVSGSTPRLVSSALSRARAMDSAITARRSEHSFGGSRNCRKAAGLPSFFSTKETFLGGSPSLSTRMAMRSSSSDFSSQVDTASASACRERHVLSGSSVMASESGRALAQRHEKQTSAATHAPAPSFMRASCLGARRSESARRDGYRAAPTFPLTRAFGRARSRRRLGSSACAR